MVLDSQSRSSIPPQRYLFLRFFRLSLLLSRDNHRLEAWIEPRSTLFLNHTFREYPVYILTYLSHRSIEQFLSLFFLSIYSALKVSLPSDSSMTTLHPSRISPLIIIDAISFSMLFWRNLLIGLAP